MEKIVARPEGGGRFGSDHWVDSNGYVSKWGIPPMK